MEQDRWCRNSWVKTNELLRNWHLRKPRGPSLQATWTSCRAGRWAFVGRSRDGQRTSGYRAHLSSKSPFGHLETRFGRCFSFPWKVQCPRVLGRSCLRLSVQPASTALSHRSLEKMKLYLVLLLISYLLTPVGAAILGRCTVAKQLYDGGLDYFEGYSLENWVCLAYFESKFNPSAVYENPQDGSTGFGLFQIRDNEWCDHGKNLCSVSCTALLNPNLKDTIECAKKIVKGKHGMGAWPIWSKNCQLSDILDRWLDGCDL